MARINRRITKADKEAWRKAKAEYQRGHFLGLCASLDWSGGWTETRFEQLMTWRPDNESWVYWWPTQNRRARLRVLNALIAGKLGPNR